ncbi:MAG: hypothetical protein MUO90_00720 [Dehalococcoidales bacterium]|nr:hypothetical protein [Dehalococcoidales bacterium]
MNKELPSNNIEQKLVDCISRLKVIYLRGLEKKKEAILSSEAMDKGSKAEIIKLKEQGIVGSAQLREEFHQRSTMSQKRGGTDGAK